MMNWLPTSPLLTRPPSQPDLRDMLAAFDGWSIAELMRNERFAQAPDESLPPASAMNERAEPAVAWQPDWLANAQWQSASEIAPWPEPPSMPRPSISEDPFERAAIRLRRRTPSRYSPMGPPFLNETPQDYPSHLGPVPQAPEWEQVITNPTSPWSPLAQPPRATDWGRTTPSIDEAVAAEEARRAWARRLGQWDRRGTQEYEPPPSPLPLPPPPAEPSIAAEEARRAAAMRTGQWRRRNQRPYEGYTAPPPAAPADDGDLGERVRLNLLDSYYRGSLFGAGRLALMRMLSGLSNEGVSPATRRVRDELRKEYQQILADLGRYDRMSEFQNPSEFGAAALGQLGGMAFNGIVANPLAVRLGQMARYGHEMHIGGMRIAPFGNRTGHLTGRWPHYHRRRPDPSRPRDSLPGHSIRRHRPWDRRASDVSILDRF
jgi:hypothetical protein